MEEILENTPLQHDIKLSSVKINKKGQFFSRGSFRHEWML